MGSKNPYSEVEPLVSIVTPFRNTDKYLTECIESVLAQTYNNWEYILVNNCSSDLSAAIAEKYAKKERRIRLIHNDVFLSQVQNYNHALRQISRESKYCKIVQADEWIFPECLRQMVKIAEDNPSVGIVGSFWLKGEKVSQFGLPSGKTTEVGREICRSNLLRGKYYFGNPTSLLIRSEIIRSRNPFYNEGRLNEDTEACYEILIHWDFGFVHQVLTFWRMDNVNDSLSSNTVNFDPDYFLTTLIHARKQGPIFLDEKEYKVVLKRIEQEYYSFLGKSIFTGKGRKFWDYHRRGLETIGVKLFSLKLVIYAAIVLLNLFLNPKSTFERMIKVCARRL